MIQFTTKHQIDETMLLLNLKYTPEIKLFIDYLNNTHVTNDKIIISDIFCDVEYISDTICMNNILYEENTNNIAYCYSIKHIDYLNYPIHLSGSLADEVLQLPTHYNNYIYNNNFEISLFYEIKTFQHKFDNTKPNLELVYINKYGITIDSK